ncbi:TetR/AcrR family transcriptional regulator [Actinokineospora bangkokensis]|uniref:TetR family transcriptional regulator n=1 Tax=Actinokineospora bangkokensis TaxID=1193682 RepID=A0A1Q9LQT8_9PSEU|nr:TetR/AcrR family transcriptional regulator [Actinokineospora bangkokensis]OLR94388.1 TetR family transcriptional regulator [Actinokineospora bangkokensis]
MEQGRTRAERRAATAAKILEAARAEFGERGESATVRSIARRAGVDPSLVLQHYGSKQELFALAVRPVAELRADDVAGHLGEVLDARMRDLPPATRALMRSMLTSPEATSVMRDYLQERASVLAGAMPDDDGELRAAVIVSSILGLTIARHFLDLAPLTTADPARTAAVFDAWLAPLAAPSTPD